MFSCYSFFDPSKDLIIKSAQALKGGIINPPTNNFVFSTGEPDPLPAEIEERRYQAVPQDIPEKAFLDEKITVTCQGCGARLDIDVNCWPELLDDPDIQTVDDVYAFFEDEPITACGSSPFCMP